MSDRAAQPPLLDGYTYERLIGQGGFADVFLYTQQRPSRPVAVKVLLDSDLDGPGRRRFDAEANVMAQLATHPAIVPIYQADIAADGRPYLVMEFCPRPNLSLRSRAERVSVPEALEITIAISGAVETAHRAGILHRDIKPHNVLTNDYGHPKLTDFGIAVVTGETAETEVGLSIPWSPPEMFHGRPPEDPRADVWSLAATLFTVLAGRSPFEVAGGTNSSPVLIDRIHRQPLPRLDRPDLPAQLQSVLECAMSKDPQDRYPSAHAFARALQDVQIDLHLAPTRIDVLDASASRPVGVADDGRTRVSPVLVIDPEAPPTTSRSATGTTRGTATAPAAPTNGFPAYDVARTATPDTVLRPGRGGTGPHATGPHATGTTSPTDSAATAGRKSSTTWRLLLAAAAVATLVVGGVLVARGGEDPQPATRPSLDAPPEDQSAVITDGVVPAPVDVIGTRDGAEVTFTWTNPDPQPGDFYLWTREGDTTDAGSAPEAQRAAEPTLTFRTEPDAPACVRVLIARADGALTAAASSPLACAP